MEINNTKYYTSERNVQIVISLLKQHGIRRVIASPGTTNMTFIGSIQQDKWFQIWSCVDERSAAYMACGMAAETGEPVVISCTGATASRNYMSGLTEAYYRKLPVLAITSHRGQSEVGHLKDQQIDRSSRPDDIVMKSVTVPLVKDVTDERFCTIETNKAILALKQNGGGPAHINLYTAYSSDYSVTHLSEARKVELYSNGEDLPQLPEGRIYVLVGAHERMSDGLTNAIDAFCASYDAAVLSSHVSGYRGKYEVKPFLLFQDQYHPSSFKNICLVIHIGEVDGNTLNVRAAETWRVSKDGQIRDTFENVKKVFQMDEEEFFSHYAQMVSNKHELFDDVTQVYDEMVNNIPTLPFSNTWMAYHSHDKIPANSVIHFGILNSLRCWDLFKLPKSVYGYCNVGGYGIDGGVSSLIGASLVHSDKLYFGVFGDLAFFYDMNALGNRHIGSNVRILLVNNGRGTEFTNYMHLCARFGKDADKFMSGAGHFGQKSPHLVKHYAEDLGFRYLSASTKEEFENVASIFFNPDHQDKPILLEAFTDSKDESDALYAIKHIVEEQPQPIPLSLKAKQAVYKVLGEKFVRVAKIIMNRG